MKATITVKQTYTVEIDGQRIQGDFKISSEWEGMIKLECSGPMGRVIIRDFKRPLNAYDLVPKMLGGNADNCKPIQFEADVVQTDCVKTKKPTARE